MIKHDKENKDYDELIKLYDEPVERAIARELFKLDQDQLRALLEDKIEIKERKEEKVELKTIDEILKLIKKGQ